MKPSRIIVEIISMNCGFGVPAWISFVFPAQWGTFSAADDDIAACVSWAVESVFTENVTETSVTQSQLILFLQIKQWVWNHSVHACLQADCNLVTVCVIRVWLNHKIMFNVLIKEEFMQMRKFYSISLQGCFYPIWGVKKDWGNCSC